jgi:hypothetical protein
VPADFVPPGPTPEVMEIEKELLTKEEHDKLKQEVGGGSFSKIVRSGVLNAQTRPLLQKGARYFTHRLSMKDQRAQLHDNRVAFMRLVYDAATLQENPQNARQFREFFLKEIAARAAELLDGNFQVRLAGVLILSDLNIVEEDSRKNIAAEAFIDPLADFLKILADKDQPDAVKIHAAKGVKRIAEFGRPSTLQKIAMADTLIAELEQADRHPWYQQRVAETLGAIDQQTDQFGKPFIAQALAKVVADDTRHCRVRAESAKALGRTPLDPQVNVANLAFGVAAFTRQMAEQYNKSPQDVQWKDCFWKAYLAFRPLNAAERSKGAGLLTKVDKAPYGAHKAKVTEAYQQMLPLVKHALANTAAAPMPAAALDPMTDWLKKNQPADYRVAPNTPPLSALQASSPAVKPAG